MFLKYIIYDKTLCVKRSANNAITQCNSSALLNRYMQNPFKIAFGDGILHS